MVSSKMKKYALIPCEDRVELHQFDGTFDEGEGFSMGHPIKWKYPNNTKIIKVMALLSAYNSKIGELVKEALTFDNEVYVEGLPGLTGWWNKNDI